MATITLTATPEVTFSPPRVRLDVTVTGTPAPSQLVVQRRDDTGHTSPVRTSDGGPLPLSGGRATIYDYEPSYGAPATYSTDQPGGPSVAATLNVPDIWLVNVAVPARSVRLDKVFALGEDERATSASMFQILDRPDPVPVSSGARPTATAVLGVRTLTDAQRRAMHALLDDDAPVLLNMPASKSWGVDTCYLTIGAVRAPRTVRVGSVPLREWTLLYQVIGRPGGGTQAVLTWDDIAARYPTWQAIADAGITSWAELAAPTT